MTKRNIRLIREDVTKFGDVLSTISAEKKFNQYQLATETGYSQAAISRIENGTRSLSPKFAAKLEEALGGEKEKWLKVFEQTENGSELPVAYFRDFLLGQTVADDLPGVRIRRMTSEDILSIFGSSSGTMTFRGVEENCEITFFDASAVEKTSYDTHVGGYIDPEDPREKRAIQIEDKVLIPKNEQRLIIVKEHITLPSWLEAELHPASNLAMKGLIVSNGPIIDPGWSGFLKVSVFNPTRFDREVSVDEAFLTLRFWMQESH